MFFATSEQERTPSRKINTCAQCCRSTIPHHSFVGQVIDTRVDNTWGPSDFSKQNKTSLQETFATLFDA